MPDFGVLNAPPLVKQVDEMSCWAAAMEAWLAVASGRKARSQHELIGVMQQKGALNDDGYLIIKKGIPILAQMACQSLYPLSLVTVIVAKQNAHRFFHGWAGTGLRSMIFYLHVSCSLEFFKKPSRPEPDLYIL